MGSKSPARCRNVSCSSSMIDEIGGGGFSCLSGAQVFLQDGSVRPEYAPFMDAAYIMLPDGTRQDYAQYQQNVWSGRSPDHSQLQVNVRVTEKGVTKFQGHNIYHNKNYKVMLDGVWHVVLGKFLKASNDPGFLVYDNPPHSRVKIFEVYSATSSVYPFQFKNQYIQKDQRYKIFASDRWQVVSGSQLQPGCDTTFLVLNQGTAQVMPVYDVYLYEADNPVSENRRGGVFSFLFRGQPIYPETRYRIFIENRWLTILGSQLQLAEDGSVCIFCKTNGEQTRIEQVFLADSSKSTSSGQQVFPFTFKNRHIHSDRQYKVYICGQWLTIEGYQLKYENENSLLVMYGANKPVRVNDIFVVRPECYTPSNMVILGVPIEADRFYIVCIEGSGQIIVPGNHIQRHYTKPDVGVIWHNGKYYEIITISLDLSQYTQWRPTPAGYSPQPGAPSSPQYPQQVMPGRPSSPPGSGRVRVRSQGLDEVRTKMTISCSDVNLPSNTPRQSPSPGDQYNIPGNQYGSPGNQYNPPRNQYNSPQTNVNQSNYLNMNKQRPASPPNRPSSPGQPKQAPMPNIDIHVYNHPEGKSCTGAACPFCQENQENCNIAPITLPKNLHPPECPTCSPCPGTPGILRDYHPQTPEQFPKPPTGKKVTVVSASPLSSTSSVISFSDDTKPGQRKLNQFKDMIIEPDTTYTVLLEDNTSIIVEGRYIRAKSGKKYVTVYVNERKYKSYFIRPQTPESSSTPEMSEYVRPPSFYRVFVTGKWVVLPAHSVRPSTKRPERFVVLYDGRKILIKSSCVHPCDNVDEPEPFQCPSPLCQSPTHQSPIPCVTTPTYCMSPIHIPDCTCHSVRQSPERKSPDPWWVCPTDMTRSSGSEDGNLDGLDKYPYPEYPAPPMPENLPHKPKNSVVFPLKSLYTTEGYLRPEYSGLIDQDEPHVVVPCGVMNRPLNHAPNKPRMRINGVIIFENLFYKIVIDDTVHVVSGRYFKQRKRNPAQFTVKLDTCRILIPAHAIITQYDYSVAPVAPTNTCQVHSPSQQPYNDGASSSDGSNEPGYVVLIKDTWEKVGHRAVRPSKTQSGYAVVKIEEIVHLILESNVKPLEQYQDIVTLECKMPNGEKLVRTWVVERIGKGNCLDQLQHEFTPGEDPVFVIRNSKYKIVEDKNISALSTYIHSHFKNAQIIFEDDYLQLQQYGFGVTHPIWVRIRKHEKAHYYKVIEDLTTCMNIARIDAQPQPASTTTSYTVKTEHTYSGSGHTGKTEGTYSSHVEQSSGRSEQSSGRGRHASSRSGQSPGRSGKSSGGGVKNTMGMVTGATSQSTGNLASRRRVGGLSHSSGAGSGCGYQGRDFGASGAGAGGRREGAGSSGGGYPGRNFGASGGGAGGGGAGGSGGHGGGGGRVGGGSSGGYPGRDFSGSGAGGAGGGGGYTGRSGGGQVTSASLSKVTSNYSSKSSSLYDSKSRMKE